jgi:excisionase family DNA binding protein
MPLEMLLGDREFTSEEVATLCGVTRVTVADWIARGKIGVRWTSGGHRRIPRASLAEFMSKQGYALPRIVSNAGALVLAIDDESEWRERVRHLLEGTGVFQVETMQPGVDALLSIGVRCPDVLLIDTRMPGFDAPQLIESVRREKALCDTIIVALTTYEEESAGARRFGADSALTKSRVADLAPLLVRILTERQRRVIAGDGDAVVENRGPRRHNAPLEVS